ncbi:hypothetical protein [Rhizobium sp. WW_1]|jgi:hypothetical protein|uniref:hypothetical protein n=1 Tax=Rhizobium sp. WW_1 TaxID=1907375 RepID=UPI00064609FA|nr:hypothetical protein [Rhizobium sp. WW_1]RKD69021.1 hypothetical protein BJ928_104159 [Rhizobium sp. WW_1]
MAKLNPYIRIMRAADRGGVVRLTAKEVWYLSQDSSIAAVATLTEDLQIADAGGFFVTKTGFIDKDSSQ